MTNAFYCRHCGAPLSANTTVCPQCSAAQYPEQPKNRIAAALLAIFLGSFGIHKFYLKQVGLGILYLVFCWTGIPAIVGFIEGIIWLCYSDATFAQKYH